jgi:hypothetical protein
VCILPQQIHTGDYSRCVLVSREYRLEINDTGLKVLKRSGGNLVSIIALLGAVVGVTSIISGSVALVSNTINY